MGKEVIWVEVEGRKFTFDWVCAYQGEVDYTVVEVGRDTYRIRYRCSAEPWRPGYWTMTEEHYNSEVVGSIGLAVLCGAGRLDPVVLKAFNAHRLAVSNRDLDIMCSKPEIYGQIDRNDPMWTRFATPAKTGHYIPGLGWQIDN